MPLLCGSTTPSASMVAMAASVALPPARRISTPAAAARGSAALTMPCAGALPVGWRAAATVEARASGAASSSAWRIMAQP